MMDTKTEEISLEKEGTQHHDKYKTREDVSTIFVIMFFIKSNDILSLLQF